jgi:hypothetical protein
VHTGLWVSIGIGTAALACSLAIPALSGARLRKPDLESWLEEGRQALPSPRTAVHVRPRVEDDDAEPLVPSSLRRR